MIQGNTRKVMQGRNDKGQFQSKSDGFRRVRSIRVTDEVWDKLGKIADKRGITRADLLEQLVEVDLSSAVEILKDALKLRANAGGAIKREIRRVLLIFSKLMF